MPDTESAEARAAAQAYFDTVIRPRQPGDDLTLQDPIYFPRRRAYVFIWNRTGVTFDDPRYLIGANPLIFQHGRLREGGTHKPIEDQLDG